MVYTPLFSRKESTNKTINERCISSFSKSPKFIGLLVLLYFLPWKSEMASFECVCFFLVSKYCSHVGQFPKIAFFLTQYRQQSKISNIIDRQRRCPDRRRPRARRIRNTTRAWHIWAEALRIGQLGCNGCCCVMGKQAGRHIGRHGCVQ